MPRLQTRGIFNIYCLESILTATERYIYCLGSVSTEAYNYLKKKEKIEFSSAIVARVAPEQKLETTGSSEVRTKGFFGCFLTK